MWNFYCTFFLIARGVFLSFYRKHISEGGVLCSYLIEYDHYVLCPIRGLLGFFLYKKWIILLLGESIIIIILLFSKWHCQLKLHKSGIWYLLLEL